MDNQNLIDVITSTKYTPLKLLGEGSYGSVLSVKNRDGIIKAMKLMEYNFDHLECIIDDYFSCCEVYFTKLFKHPHIIERDEIGFTKKYSYYIMDQAECVFTDLIPKLSENQMYQYIYQIADAIEYIHRGGYVYCDIKPSNILIINGVLKIADLGYVKVKENTYNDNYASSLCQTLNYRSPEHYTNDEKYLEHYNKIVKRYDNISLVKSEYWSLGILFLDVIYRTAFLTFEGNSEIRMAGRTNYLYYSLLEILSQNYLKNISVIDSICAIFGMPDDYLLLEAVCNHLLQLNPNDRNLDAFMEDIAFASRDLTKSNTPFLYPYTEQMYTGSHLNIKYHQRIVNWMVNVADEYSIPLLTLMNGIDFYIQYCHRYNKTKWTTLSIVSIWMVDRLFNPTDECIPLKNLIDETDGNVSINDINYMIKELMITTNGYPVFEALYFYLPTMKLVKAGYEIMIDINEYIKYQSPRNLADKLIIEANTDLINDKINIPSYVP